MNEDDRMLRDVELEVIKLRLEEYQEIKPNSDRAKELVSMFVHVDIPRLLACIDALKENS